jgi:hypothetical protein
VIDVKQKKFLEKRELSEVLMETFGTSFDMIHWFLPIKCGGYKPYFRRLKQKSE